MVALELITGTSRVCLMAITRVSGVSQTLMGHLRGLQGWLSMTDHPGAALLRGCALQQLNILVCVV